MTFNRLRICIPVLRAILPANLFLIGTAVALFSGCTKESNLGIDVQPETDIIQLSVQDTTRLITYTEREDSVRSDEPPVCLFGTQLDPVFGKTTAGIFSQFIFKGSTVNINFGTPGQIVLDSLVLTLGYRTDFYGDTTQQQSLKVYQVTQSMFKDSVYYSNRLRQYYPAPVASKTFVPHPRTKVNVDNGLRAPHLRIPIDPGFAQLLFSQSGTTNMLNNTNWLNFLKGLYIAPDGNPTGEGAIIQFGMTDTSTRLTFYYRNIVTNDTLKYSLITEAGTAAYYNHFTHDYSSATGDIQTQLAVGEGSYQNVYIHGMAGLRTKIKMPYATSWANLGPIAINKAELVIQADPTYIDALHAANSKLYLAVIDSSGSTTLPIDMTDNIAAFGGSYISGQQEYRINIPRHFLKLLRGDVGNYGLYLREIDAAQSAKRVVLGSADNPSPALKMFLRVAYTKIN